MMCLLDFPYLKLYFPKTFLQVSITQNVYTVPEVFFVYFIKIVYFHTLSDFREDSLADSVSRALQHKEVVAGPIGREEWS